VAYVSVHRLSALGADAASAPDADFQATKESYNSYKKELKDPLKAAEKTIEAETDKYMKSAAQAGAAAGCAATGVGAAAAPACAWLAGELYGPVKDGIKSVGKFFVKLFGGKKPKPPIRISAAEYVASYAQMTPLQKEYWDLYYANQTLDCMRFTALKSVLASMVTSLSEIAPGVYDIEWALSQLRDAGLPLDEYTAWRLQGRDYVSYLCDSGTPGMPVQGKFEWHLDYLPPYIARIGVNDLAKKVEIEKGFKEQSFWWIDELERASMAVITAAVVRGVKGRIPTPNQIIYLASAMTCAQLAPKGCWENETALVGALCSTSGVPKNVSPEVWKAFCAKLASCGKKPTCAQQNADLVAYAKAVEAKRNADLVAYAAALAAKQAAALAAKQAAARESSRTLLWAGTAVAAVGATWWLTRRKRKS